MRITFVQEMGYRAGDDPATATAAVVPELCVPETDVVLTSVLLTWADLLAGVLAMKATAPRIAMTNDLAVRLVARPPLGAVDLRSQVLKSGKTTSFTETWLHAAGSDEPFAVAHGTFVTSPRPQDRIPAEMANGPRETRPLLIPFPERIGARVVEPGVVEVARRDELLNPADTLQGGVIALIAELAALSVVPGAVAHELDVRYLRPTRVGPGRAVATVLRDEGACATVEVRTHDVGADDRLTAVVMARCGPVPNG